MFKKKDPYTFTKFCTLFNATDAIGSVLLEYQVTSYEDVQLADFTSVAKNRNRKFLLQCTQRINIYNPKGMNLSPDGKLSSYDDYPVLINALTSLDTNTGLDFQLLDYSPQTVNTKVQHSGSSGDSSGKTSGSSSSSTVGSSTSQTNSYGASVTLSEAPSFSANYEHSSTSTQEQSQTNGTETSNTSGRESSNSAAMSIKDWGAYGLVNPNNKNPSWTFGQEYPWDAIECRKTNNTPNPNNPSQVQIIIPDEMSLRLYDQVSLYPPSQLSMFGVNFVMKAIWLVTLDDTAADEVTVEQGINYFSGSHLLSGSTVNVFMDGRPSALQVNSPDSLTTTINLPVMALDTLGLRSKSAIVGFIPNKFIVPAPGATVPAPFKIISATNDLMIADTTTYPTGCPAGSGFTPSQTALSASFSQNCAELQMTMYFKVIDSVENYTLFIKHWATGTDGVQLTLVINNDTQNPITKYVDAAEGEGGENNLMSIVLRNDDFTSIDYHDYLQLGLNSIQITIQPINASSVADCGYKIRAISIESV